MMKLPEGALTPPLAVSVCPAMFVKVPPLVKLASDAGPIWLIAALFTVVRAAKVEFPVSVNAPGPRRKPPPT